MKSNSNKKYLIYSLVLAFIVWYFATMQVDPLVESSIYVPIVLKNTTDLSGKAYDTDEPLVAHVSYYVRTSKAEDMAAVNMSAYVDFRELPMEGDNNDNKPAVSANDTIPLKVNIEDNSNLDNIYIYNISPKYLHVRIDDYASKEFPITYISQGTLGRGYTLGDVTLMNDTALVSGSKRDIDSIDKVAIVVDLADKSASWTGTAPIKYYNEEGEELNSLNVTSSVSNVGYIASLNVAQEIKIVQYYTGTPQDGFGVKSVKITPETINAIYSVAGFNTGKTIVLPIIDISGVSESVHRKVDITGLIDSSTKLVDNIKTVDVEIEIVTSDQLDDGQAAGQRSNIIILPRATRSEADN